MRPKRLINFIDIVALKFWLCIVSATGTHAREMPHQAGELMERTVRSETGNSGRVRWSGFSGLYRGSKETTEP